MKNKNFTMIPNEILQSKTLTLTERGLLGYLLSLPPKFKVHKEMVHKLISVGKTQLDTAWKGLSKKGYIVSKRKMIEKGRYDWEHKVTNKPSVDLPSMEKPSVDKPSMENPSIYKEVINKNYIKKIINKNTNSSQGTVSQGNADNLKGKSYKELFEMGIYVNPNDFINSK
jgi:hypothetical protein